MNYMDCINRSYDLYLRSCPRNFLVSGEGDFVRDRVYEDVLAQAFNNGKTLILVDNTVYDDKLLNNIGRYTDVNIMDREVSLSAKLFDLGDTPSIMQLRSFIIGLGFSFDSAVEIIKYLRIIKETEWKMGHVIIGIEPFEKYLDEAWVRNKLRELDDRGARRVKSSFFERTATLEQRYDNLGAHIVDDFRLLLERVRPVMGRFSPTRETLVKLPLGKVGDDDQLKNTMCRLVECYANAAPGSVAVAIIDDGGNRAHISDMLSALHPSVEVHFFSRDAFAGVDDVRSFLEPFSVRMYTRHGEESSVKISRYCGKNYHTNKIAEPPEDWFSPQTIASIPSGKVIIDCYGSKVLTELEW